MSLPPQASAEEFAAALDAAFADPEVDSVVAAFIPPLVTQDEEVHMAVRTIVADHEKPCVATFLGHAGVGDGLSYEQDGDPALRAGLLHARGRHPGPQRRHPLRPVAPARPRHPGRPGRDRPRPRAEALIAAYLAGQSGGARAHA